MSEWSYILFYVMFWGLLYVILSSMPSEMLVDVNPYAINITQPSVTPPPTGNPLIDLINTLIGGVSYLTSQILWFFSLLFSNPFSGSLGNWLGFIFIAMSGALIYILMRLIRGGG